MSLTVEICQSHRNKNKNRLGIFIKHIADKLYPEARKIRLVMDNYGTHKPAALYETFAPEEAKRIGTGLNLLTPNTVAG